MGRDSRVILRRPRIPCGRKRGLPSEDLRIGSECDQTSVEGVQSKSFLDYLDVVAATVHDTATNEVPERQANIQVASS